MRPLPVIASLMVAAAFAACGPPPSPPPPPPFELRGGVGTEATVTLDLAAKGDALLTFEGGVEGASWATSGAESVVLTVIVDQERVRQVVWTDAPAAAHAVRLGTLDAGPHQVTLRVDPERTRAKDAEVHLTGVTLVADPEPALARYAPILLGREDSDRSDLPALLFGQVRDDGTRSYQVLFTNEDGGTGVNPRLQVARWGRLSDLEWAMDVEVDEDGRVTARRFQGQLHGTYDFQGPLEGDHPLLRVATTNGLFTDDGAPGPFKLAPRVVAFDDPGEPRERVMDLHPWTHALMEAEGVREGKVDPACLDPAKVWALRCYAFVDVTVSASAPLGDRRVWGVEVRTEEGGAFRSEVDLGAQARLDRTGEVRVAVPLPPGHTPAELWPYFEGDGGGPVSVTLSRPRLRRWTGEEMEDQARGEGTVTVDAAVPTARLWPD